MRVSIRFFVGILVASAAIAAPAQVQKTKSGYLFQLKFTKGQVTKIDMSMIASSTKKAVNVQIKTKCLSVDKKGVATLEVTTPRGSNNKPDVQQAQVDRHGKPVGQTFGGFNGTFMWPDKPIKVGQSWKGDMNLGDANMGKGTMTGTYKFEGIKTVNGKQVAAIRTFLDVTGEFNVAGTGVIYIKVGDGQLDSAVFNLGMAQFNDGGSPTTLKMQMNIKAHA